MIVRKIEPILKKSLAEYPVVTIIGPRQSGKTTLVYDGEPNRKRNVSVAQATRQRGEFLCVSAKRHGWKSVKVIYGQHPSRFRLP